MKEKSPKYVNGVCPYCNSPLKTPKEESVKCENCGATITYAEIKNQHAVIQQTKEGKNKFNFKNLIKKWWFWTAIAAVALLIIGICVPDLGKSTKDKDPNLYGKYAGTIQMEDFSVCMKKCTETNVIKEPDTGIDHVAQNYYLIVVVTLGNKSNESQYISNESIQIQYNGQTYDNLIVESSLYSYSNSSYGYSSFAGWRLDPEQTKTFSLVFEVPESIETAKYILSFHPADTQEVKIKLYS